ncbi:MAG: hypothetical protein WBH44_06460 [Proteocatella sp.]
MKTEMELNIDNVIEHIKQQQAEAQLKPKPLSEFRNNYKNFQYDYEEDFYEPGTSAYSDDDY